MSAELSAYWEQRAVRYGDVDRGLPAVCSYGMPRLYNEAIHVCQRLALSSLLASWSDLDVLDVGCGIGRWSIEIAKRGNRVVGVDVSQTMVSLARRNARRAGVECEFAVGGAAAFRSKQTFDVVLAVTVLQHVMDDEEFNAAIRNLTRHLKPSGQLVLLEVAPTSLTSSCDSAVFRARSLATYRTSLADAGLSIASIRGADAQLQRTLSLAALRALPTRMGRAVVSLAAPLVLPLDLVVGRLLPDASWHKVIVAKRAG
jgi:ubiquinone/menaquinone biosynthesis C-methylase UbiE